MYTQGSSARLTDLTRETPIDAVIIGIVDSVEMDGRRIDAR
jgi:microcompartment protein CcmK/EutM